MDQRVRAATVISGLLADNPGCESAVARRSGGDGRATRILARVSRPPPSERGVRWVLAVLRLALWAIAAFCWTPTETG
jgi:hypothetical protein